MSTSSHQSPLCPICVSVMGATYRDLANQITHMHRGADLIEIRLDRLIRIDFDELMQLKQITSLPLLWTLRKVSQGGYYKGSGAEQFALLRQLATKGPDLVDVEADMPPDSIEELQKLSSKTKWIVSWHDMVGTPADLEECLDKLFAIRGGTYYKLATYAHSIIDSFRLLELAKKTNIQKSQLCVVGMGELGQCTRILAPLVGQPFTFAAADIGLETAPGQLSIQTLLQTYSFRKINRQTRLFGLIGHPVDKSVSHLTHNAVFQKLQQNAVYLKFNVKESELTAFFQKIALFPIGGLSVTMPHKELVHSSIETFYPEEAAVQACNTLVFTPDGIRGYNTDGIGALKTLAMTNLKGKKMVILGAGGTARAIAHEAKKEGAQLTILNRTSRRAEMLAKQYNTAWGALDKLATLMEDGYDVLVQATSVGMAPRLDDMPILSDWILSNAHVLDVISNPQETRLLREARLKGCQTYRGIDLFVHQAVQQFVCWFGAGVDQRVIEQTIRDHLPMTSANKKYVKVQKSALNGSLSLPPSKSHSVRAVLLGAMAQGISRIDNPLHSPDVTQAICAAIELGAQVRQDDQGMTIIGVGGRPQTPAGIIDSGNSGQVLRFVGALAALSSGYTVITGDHSICSNRPAQPLLDGLSQLGVWAKSTRQNGYAPLIIKGPLIPGKAELDGTDSQPVSALLMAAAFVDGVTEIFVRKAGEKPWIALTLSWLDRLGVSYTQENFEHFVVKGCRERPSFHIQIPGDLSSAAFPIVAALVTKSEITIHRADMDDIQGDKELVYLLQSMGAAIDIDRTAGSLRVCKGSLLIGKEIDVNAFIDAVPILAVLGCFAEGETRLVNGAIARHKESDRLACITKELKKMGARIEETADGLTIHPSNLKGALVQSCQDHRMAMALIVAGLAAEGETIVEGTACIQKSYPGFIEDMRNIGAYVG